MDTLISVFRADSKRILREPFLIFMMISPFLIGLVIRWGLPKLTEMYQDQFNLLDYYPLIIALFVITPALFIGTVMTLQLLEEKDENFDRAGTEAKMNEWGATAIEECREDLTDTKFPKFFKSAVVFGLVLLFAPPILIYRAAGMTSRPPRIHIIPDMDWQDKFKAQQLIQRLVLLWK